MPTIPQPNQSLIRTIPSLAPRALPPYNQDPRYHQQPVSPVHLSGSLVLQPNTSGSIPVSSMMNPTGMDMEILEIKFEISGAVNVSSDSASVSMSSSFGGTISCELLLGSIKLTNGSVPVWLFGRCENYGAEVGSEDASSLTSYNYYSWRLPRPLYVPAGTSIQPNFTHTGMIPAAANVRISYSGRSVAVKPKRVHVPWVASYVSKVLFPLNAAGMDRSSNDDLINPSDNPLYLQRFTGRLVQTSTTAQQQIIHEGGLEIIPAQMVRIRVNDSFGRPIVRNFTAFRTVFDVTRSWEMDNSAILDPHGWYTVDVRQTANTNATYGMQHRSAQLHIGLVGWYEEDAS